MDNPHPGRLALKAWRMAHDVSQSDLGSMVVPKVSQVAVSRWEDETSQRPALSTACQIQRITGVSATLWGYSQAEIDAVMGVQNAAPADEG